MNCICYLHKGTVYIPVAARVANGGPTREIEPISIVRVVDTGDLRKAFQEVIARGNPIIPNVPRSQVPKIGVPHYAGAKSWSAFERHAQFWTMDDRDGIYRITGWKRREDRGFEPDPDQTIVLPAGTTEGLVIERMISILQAAAQPIP